MAHSSLARREDICCSVTLNPMGSTSIWEAKSCTNFVHSGVAFSARDSGMLLIRYLVPEGGGGIKRREHAHKMCLSPSLMLMITGCTALVKALTYLRASAFISNGSGKSRNSRSSSGLASLMYAHLQFKGEPSNLSAESVLLTRSHSRENH